MRRGDLCERLNCKIWGKRMRDEGERKTNDETAEVAEAHVSLPITKFGRSALADEACGLKLKNGPMGRIRPGCYG